MLFAKAVNSMGANFLTGVLDQGRRKELGVDYKSNTWVDKKPPQETAPRGTGYCLGQDRYIKWTPQSFPVWHPPPNKEHPVLTALYRPLVVEYTESGEIITGVHSSCATSTNPSLKAPFQTTYISTRNCLNDSVSIARPS